jgi:hypothetical protein
MHEGLSGVQLRYQYAAAATNVDDAPVAGAPEW